MIQRCNRNVSGELTHGYPVPNLRKQVNDACTRTLACSATSLPARHRLDSAGRSNPITWPLEDGIDVLFGGGRRHFVPNTVLDEESVRGSRTDGRDLRNEYQAAGYTYVYNTVGFNSLNRQSLPVLGLFESSHMEWEFDRASDAGGEPRLIRGALMFAVGAATVAALTTWRRPIGDENQSAAVLSPDRTAPDPPAASPPPPVPKQIATLQPLTYTLRTTWLGSEERFGGAIILYLLGSALVGIPYVKWNRQRLPS